MRFGNLGEERGARRGGGNKSELFFAVLQCVRLLIIIIEIAEKLRYSTIVSTKAISSVSWIKKKTHKYGKNQGISLALIANSILENPDMFGYHQVFDKP